MMRNGATDLFSIKEPVVVRHLTSNNTYYIGNIEYECTGSEDEDGIVADADVGEVCDYENEEQFWSSWCS